ncbi:MAG: hypothetical protein AAF799_01815 [Myxococcota bacterium]
MPRTAPTPSVSGRVIAAGVSLLLAMPAALAPSTSHAALEPAPAPAPSAADDAAVQESRALYVEGKARFDTFDYNGAVDLWTKAYAKLPPDAAGVRNAMVYNIATAQEKAYDLDKDLQHLRQAVLLLESYIKNYKVLYKRTPETEAEVSKAEDRIALLKERIAAAERGEQTPPPVVAPTETPPPTEPAGEFGGAGVDGIQWNTGHNPPVDQDLLAKNRRLAAEERKTDAMLVGSYVALSVGGLFTLAGVSAIVAGNVVDDTMPTDPNAGRGARGAGYGTLAFGLAGLATGVTLIVIGFDRRKKAREGTLVAGTPVVGPGFAGASMRVRF